MNSVYKNELHHFGIKGMKWGSRRSNGKNSLSKKEKRKIEDDKILEARKQRDKALIEYNKKANHANLNMHDKKAQSEADESYMKFVELASKANQQTSKEKNKQRTAVALAVVGSLALSAVGASLGKLK